MTELPSISSVLNDRRHVLEAEVDSDGSQVALLKLVISEPPQQRTLAYGAVADECDLKQIVVFHKVFIIADRNLSYKWTG